MTGGGQARVALAVMGAGLIGRQHAERIATSPEARLAAIVDPAPAARDVAATLGVPCHRDLDALLATDRPDGLIVATPNALHHDHGQAAIAAGLPLLMEKPVTDTIAAGEALVAAADKAGVPLLVGHHRRHNPLIAAAKAAIAGGRLGRVLMVQGQFWLVKPPAYFAVDWRTQPGAGPVLLNLIHDIDLLRHLVGEIVSVQAVLSHDVRHHAVEDMAAIVLSFAHGAIGTLSACDAAVGPWSWELTAGENAAYPRQDQSCYQIGGTEASLAVPQLDLWYHPGQVGWMDPLARERLPFRPEDPLRAQIRQFCAVIRSEEAPLVSGRDGLETLRVVEAIKEAARRGAAVTVSTIGGE